MHTQKSIVIVEDEEMLREMASERFRSAGYKVNSFSNGLDMLANISDLHPDVIILDIMTPEIDGYGVLESIRKNFTERKFEHVPIVIWSNISDPDSIQHAIRLGASLYLPKIDYPGDELVTKISDILNSNTL